MLCDNILTYVRPVCGLTVDLIAYLFCLVRVKAEPLIVCLLYYSATFILYCRFVRFYCKFVMLVLSVTWIVLQVCSVSPKLLCRVL